MAAARRASSAFNSGEVALAFALGLAVEIGVFVLFVAAGTSGMHIKSKDPPPPEPIPMKVLPVLDDAPLLKLGGKKVKPKLPDMWKKNPPVQRFEEKSAPSPLAEKTPEAIPTSPLALKDAEAPPPDAEVAKEVDQVLLDAGPPDAEPPVEGEGAADGVKEGTETDPLKARAVSGYRMKLIAWFNARFQQPTEIPCEELKGLRASVSVSVGGDRTVTGYTAGSSGNAAFDGRVKATLDAAKGQELPPPPPLYPDILESQLSFAFSGRCND